MKWDGYGATFRGQDPSFICEVVAQSVGGLVTNGRPMRRYPVVRAIECGHGMAAWVGMDESSGLVYMEAKGETTPKVVNAIRAHFPDHTAPRLDVCEDYDEPGVFPRLIDLVRAHKGPRVKGGYVALPDDESDGKTWAAGVRGGVGYVRVYESGKHPDRVHLGRPDLTRAELEMRPHYAKDKAAAARMSPVEVWGLAAWTQKVGEALTQVDIPRAVVEARKYSFDKTTRYIATAFRRHLEEMLANGEDLGRTFQAVWEEEDEQRARRGAGGSAPRST